MRFHTRCHIIAGLLFLLQFSDAGESKPEDIALIMQRNVEHLIEKILNHVGEHYQKVKGELKCIPDYIPDRLIETLKNSIDCVHANEKTYVTGKINGKVHLKNFLKCFSDAKKEVQETMKAIDPTRDHCPENMTEKTYQINVTTTFTKTFQINIKNGLEVTHKEIDFGKRSSVTDSDSHNYNYNVTERESTDVYDVSDLKLKSENESYENSGDGREEGESLEDTVNEITEFITGKRNDSEDEATTSPENDDEKPKARSEALSTTESVEESEEDGYYDVETESSVRDNEYEYGDERNGSESRDHVEKIKPQRENFDVFEEFEKHITSGIL